MNGLIIVNSYAELKGITYQSERMKEELAIRGVSSEIHKTTDFCYGSDAGETLFDFDADFVLFFDKDKYLSRIIEKKGIRLFNSAQAIELCDDKMLTCIALSDNNIPMPHTLPAPLCYIEGKEPDKAFLNRVAEKLSFPLVAKTSFGSLGKGVTLIDDYAELVQAEKNMMFIPHLYQKFCKESKGRDIRVIVIGGKAVACMLRENANDFRSNIEIGGRGEKTQPDNKFISIAERAAEALNLDYCGVDLLFGSNGEPLVCEINSNAFFTGIEACTGINVAGAYADYICHKIYHERKISLK